MAKAVRIALEIEDKNISAKKTRGKYKEKIYNQKHDFIAKLCNIFKEQNWAYGVQKTDNYSASHIIYFEIPGCEQLSWHFTPNNPNVEVFRHIKDVPIYAGEWDKKTNSALDKLEKISLELLKKYNLS